METPTPDATSLVAMFAEERLAVGNILATGCATAVNVINARLKLSLVVGVEKKRRR